MIAKLTFLQIECYRGLHKSCHNLNIACFQWLKYWERIRAFDLDTRASSGRRIECYRGLHKSYPILNIACFQWLKFASLWLVDVTHSTDKPKTVPKLSCINEWKLRMIAARNVIRSTANSLLKSDKITAVIGSLRIAGRFAAPPFLAGTYAWLVNPFSMSFSLYDCMVSQGGCGIGVLCRLAAHSIGPEVIVPAGQPGAGACLQAALHTVPI